MRIIKFRAWDKVFSKMIEVTDLNLKTGYLIGFVEHKLVSCKFIDCDLLQYTGLKDKSCVEIYEGDVLRDSESIVIVKFVSGEFSVDYRTMGGKWRNYGSLFDYLEDYEGEIIGNIYEHSYLLE